MKIKLINDPALRTMCEPVVLGDIADIVSSIPEMEKVMAQEGGLALAANQVGILKRFFIMRCESGIRLFINPEIVSSSNIRPFDEGCLSIPGTSAVTQRATKVTLKFNDQLMNLLEEEFVGINAIAIQHEIDHLNGKLYVDQLLPMQRLLALKKHKQFLKARSRR